MVKIWTGVSLAIALSAGLLLSGAPAGARSLGNFSEDFRATIGTATTYAEGGFTGSVDNLVLTGANKIVGDGSITLDGVTGTTNTHTVKRFNLDGTVDTTFTAPLFDGNIAAMQLLSTGDIVVGGSFMNAAPVTSDGNGGYTAGTAVSAKLLAVLDGTSGALVGGFTSPFTQGSGGAPAVNDLAIDSSDNIYGAGSYLIPDGYTDGTTNRTILFKTSSTGAYDSTFMGNVKANLKIYYTSQYQTYGRAIAIDEAHNRVFIGGQFHSSSAPGSTFDDGCNCNSIAALSLDGVLDEAWNFNSLKADGYAGPAGPASQGSPATPDDRAIGSSTAVARTGSRVYYGQGAANTTNNLSPFDLLVDSAAGRLLSVGSTDQSIASFALQNGWPEASDSGVGQGADFRVSTGAGLTLWGRVLEKVDGTYVVGGDFTSGNVWGGGYPNTGDENYLLQYGTSSAKVDQLFNTRQTYPNGPVDAVLYVPASVATAEGVGPDALLYVGGSFTKMVEGAMECDVPALAVYSDGVGTAMDCSAPPPPPAPVSGGGSGISSGGSGAAATESTSTSGTQATPALQVARAGELVPFVSTTGTVVDVPAGEARYIYADGRVEETPVELMGSQLGGLTAGLDEFQMDLEGNEPGAATEDPVLQRLIFKTGKEGIATGLGFKPGTEAEVWLFSEQIFLGYATIKDDGTFEKEFVVPTGIDLGQHTLQAEGTARAGGDRAVSAGVVISDDPQVAKRKPVTKRVVIPFEKNSAVLSPKSKKRLKKYMSRDVTKVTVQGFVQPSGGLANDMALSEARAKRAATFLVRPKQRVNVKVEGVGRRLSKLAECKEVKNRCAVVSISYVPKRG